MPWELFQLDRTILEPLSEAMMAEWQESVAAPSLVPLPEPPPLEAFIRLVEVAIRASHETEEGVPVSFELCWLRPDHASAPLISALPFSKPHPLSPEAIRKLAPALTSGRSVIAVGAPEDHDAEAGLWGLCKPVTFGFLLRAPKPGVAAVHYGGRLMAVISAGQLHLVNPDFVGPKVEGPRELLESLLPFGGTDPERFVTSALILSLVRFMSNRHAGGTLVLIPGSFDDNLIKHKFETPSTTKSPLRDGLLHVKRQLVESYHEQHRALREQLTVDRKTSALTAMYIRRKAFGRVPDLAALEGGSSLSDDTAYPLMTTARLAGVDGALILDLELRVIGFGAQLKEADKERQVTVRCFDALTTDDLDGKEIALEDLGGTRHRSAARFVADTQTAIAVVVSHDGPISVMTWNASSNAVHVLRNVQLLLA